MVAGVGLVALGIVSINAYATFSGTATVSQAAVTAGHMQLTVPAAGVTNRLTLGASGIAPGDTLSRALDLNVDASTTASLMTGITLTVTASPSSALNTDATNGLKIWIAKCSLAWTETGTTPAFSYTCGGTQSDVLGTSASPTAISTVSASALSNVTTSASANNKLMVKLTFPTAAGDTFQDATSTLSFAFTGTQRAGSAQ